MALSELYSAQCKINDLIIALRGEHPEVDVHVIKLIVERAFNEGEEFGYRHGVEAAEENFYDRYGFEG